MSLSNQVHVYSLDTSDFYNEAEFKIHKQLNKRHLYRKNLIYKREKVEEDDDKKYFNLHITKTNKVIKKLKEKLTILFSKNSNIRILDRNKLIPKKIVSMFDSASSRVLQIPINTLTEDIMIVQTYFFDVLEDIILDGFLLGEEKYICYTASSGQIRNKKTEFIKESVLIKNKNTLMCGLTLNIINNLDGVNVNKYLAYLALNNSATDIWYDFDINKSIVVDDMETTIRGLVDFIDDETYEITRKEMDLLINHTDGVGMVLKNDKNFMTRLPWIKGLMVCHEFDKFIREHSSSGIVKDIYGKEYNVIKDGVEVIFTKSQFKMYKYYTSWQDYCDKFIKYNCHATKCNEEEDYFEYAKTNYQMIQTLTDMTDQELIKIATKTNTYIENIGSDKNTKLRVLGVTCSNNKKNNIQKALEIYPDLLNDSYCKKILKQVKKSIVKEGKSGKLEINGKYTFISPDLYAFCQYLFLGIKKPDGLLKNGEVYCNLYKDSKKLDCLRSPHLYREHAIRNNVTDEEKKKWFVTNALYVSSHDLISKLIMNDWDGDKSLVCAEPTIIEVGERNMEDIVPLHYNMKKAPSIQISNAIIFNGLKLAYTGGNIGIKSNDITKIWNSEEINLDAIKLLCMENNFTIDYAKTLYKPERPKDKHKLITKYTKSKTPHFFIYVKDKKENNVAQINNSVVNRLSKLIKNTRLTFTDNGLEKFDYKMLMRNKYVESNKDIIDKYTELDLRQHFLINPNDDKKKNKFNYKYESIKNQILMINPDIYYVTDVLVQYLYQEKKSSYKTTLWECFGDIIVENLNINVSKKNIYCKECGVLVEQTAKYHKYCKICAKEIWKKQVKINMRDYRSRLRYKDKNS